MKRTLLKSKIHRATVTDADLNYEGSISIDKSLCEKADMIEFEKVDIYNITNGERFSTYVIYGEKAEIGLNGKRGWTLGGDLRISFVHADVEFTDVQSLNIDQIRTRWRLQSSYGLPPDDGRRFHTMAHRGAHP